MAVGAGFFDETVDEVVYVVAGFVANNKLTAHLELQWNKLLKKHNLRYFPPASLAIAFHTLGVGEVNELRACPWHVVVIAQGPIPWPEVITALPLSGRRRRWRATLQESEAYCSKAQRRNWCTSGPRGRSSHQ
jgi:hypothetical protein